MEEINGWGAYQNKKLENEFLKKKLRMQNNNILLTPNEIIIPSNLLHNTYCIKYKSTIDNYNSQNRLIIHEYKTKFERLKYEYEKKIIENEKNIKKIKNILELIIETNETNDKISDENYNKLLIKRNKAFNHVINKLNEIIEHSQEYNANYNALNNELNSTIELLETNYRKFKKNIEDDDIYKNKIYEINLILSSIQDRENKNKFENDKMEFNLLELKFEKEKKQFEEEMEIILENFKEEKNIFENEKNIFNEEKNIFDEKKNIFEQKKEDIQQIIYEIEKEKINLLNEKNIFNEEKNIFEQEKQSIQERIFKLEEENTNKTTKKNIFEEICKKDEINFYNSKIKYEEKIKKFEKEKRQFEKEKKEFEEKNKSSKENTFKQMYNNDKIEINNLRIQLEEEKNIFKCEKEKFEYDINIFEYKIKEFEKEKKEFECEKEEYEYEKNKINEENYSFNKINKISKQDSLNKMYEKYFLKCKQQRNLKHLKMLKDKIIDGEIRNNKYKGSSEDMMFEVKGIESEKKLCVYESLLCCGYNCKNFGFKPEDLRNIRNLTKLIDDNKLPISIIMNSFTLKPDLNISKRPNTLIQIEYKKKMRDTYVCSITNDDINLSYLYESEIQEHYIIFDEVNKHCDYILNKPKLLDNIKIGYGNKIYKNNKLLFTGSQMRVNNLVNL